MSHNSLDEYILSLPKFVATYRGVLKDSVSKEFSGFSENANLNQAELDWRFLLLSASVLALSKLEKAQEAALRIAHVCLSRPKATPEQRAAGAVILSQLSNEPAIRLAEKRGLIPPTILSEIPAPLLLDKVARAFDHSVVVRDGELLSLNPFQSEVYSKAKSTSWLSVSAPTSAGKSFVLGYLVEDFLKQQGNGAVCFLVPTRALISQVETDLVQRLIDSETKGVYVSSVPRLPEGWAGRSLVFVLTQERLKWLLDDSAPNFGFDLLVVDEAQKISDGHRGLLLQQAISEATVRRQQMRTIFSSPLTDNPEMFLKDAPNVGSIASIPSSYLAVNQNLVWVEQIPRHPKEWTFTLVREEETLNIGQVTLPESPGVSGVKRIAALAFATGGESGVLVYADVPSEAEKVALELWRLSGEKITIDRELKDFIKVVKETIHRDFVLATALSRGVAFHYGNMPTSIRSEIERFFKEGKIRFLVCTATLIEGVNLGARTLYLRGPKKGRRVSINEVDFWNLAGRAGRLGSDFQGNIVCVDVSKEGVWDAEPPKKRARYSIKRASDISSGTLKRLIKFISDGTPRGEALSEPFLEYAFSHYFSDLRKKGSIEIPSLSATDKKLVDALQNAIALVGKKVSLPVEIYDRNPGISPLAMEALFEYFKHFDRSPEELIPVSPKDRDAAEKSYTPILGRIFKYLSGDHHAIAFPRAILVVNWTKGLPLAAIIDKELRYWVPKGHNPPAVIRETMELVEQFARYKFAKYASCYLDVLKHHFSLTGKGDLVARIPNLHMWLEFGASQETQLSLMSLGLSRAAALAISKTIESESLNQGECEVEVARLPEEELRKLPKSVMEEVIRVKQFLALNAQGK